MMIPSLEWGSITPWLVLCGAILLALAVDLFTGRYQKYVVGLVGFLGLFLSLVFVVTDWGEEIRGFGGLVSFDPLSAFLDSLLLVSAVFSILLSFRYTVQEGIDRGEYYILLLISTLGMMVMVHATDLVVLFIGLETLSVPIYALSGIRGGRADSTEAALKYYLLGSFASALFLFGIAWLYVWTGSTGLEALRAHSSEPLLGRGVAVGLILAGLAFKIAAAPFHMWAPDVYEGAPTSVTAFMAAGVKIAAVGVTLRMIGFALPGLQAIDWSSILWVLAALSMVVGNVTAIAQTNIKRMLAYSSIAHAGYLFVGLVAFNEIGSMGVLFYLFAYALMIFGSFGVVMAMGRQGDERLNLEDYAGAGWRHPFLGFAMVILMFSLAGLPPTAGFIGKFYLLSGAVKAGYTGLALLAVLTSAVSVFYYLRVLMYMYMKPSPEASEGVVHSLFTPTGLAILGSLGGILYGGILPSKLLALIQKSVEFLL